MSYVLYLRLRPNKVIIMKDFFIILIPFYAVIIFLLTTIQLNLAINLQHLQAIAILLNNEKRG